MSVNRAAFIELSQLLGHLLNDLGANFVQERESQRGFNKAFLP